MSGLVTTPAWGTRHGSGACGRGNPEVSGCRSWGAKPRCRCETPWASLYSRECDVKWQIQNTMTERERKRTKTGRRKTTEEWKKFSLNPFNDTLFVSFERG